MPDLHARVIGGFALAMQQSCFSFTANQPKPNTNGNAVRLDNWAIGLNLDGPADQHFGRYANCNPISRCLNCSPFCKTETPAVDLSIRFGSCSALWIEAQELFGRRPRVTVRSFVPGRPQLSDVWIPTLCPITGRLQLVATAGSRTAILQPDGTLLIGSGECPAERMQMAFMMFVRWWKSLIPQSHDNGRADLEPVAIAARSAW